MPWSKKQRRLQKMPLQKDVDMEKMFEIVKHDVSFSYSFGRTRIRTNDIF